MPRDPVNRLTTAVLACLVGKFELLATFSFTAVMKVIVRLMFHIAEGRF
jgi:hypothetical protein